MSTPISLEEAKTEQRVVKSLFSAINIKLQRKTSQFVTLSGYTVPLNLDIPEAFWDFCLQHQPSANFPVLVASINSEEIEQLNIQVSIEEQKAIISDAELKPKINLNGAYFQDQVDTPEAGQNLDRNNFIVGLEANWAIWDSHKVRHKKSGHGKKGKVSTLN